jgi:hypothetical protein
VDLADFWRGALSLRRLSVLIANLPVESHTWAIRNGVPFGWTPAVSMTADVYHALTGESHPASPHAKKKADPALVAERLRRQQARLAERTPPPT